MSLFNLKMKIKTKNNKSSGCCCGNCNASAIENAEKTKNSGSYVKILGSDGEKCKQLKSAVYEALKELSMDTSIDYITDFAEIAVYGIMTTPALVVDGKVVSIGKVLKKDEIINILKKS